MDALQARERLRRRYLFPRDVEVQLDREGYAGPETSTPVEKKEKPLPRLNIHSGFWILASIAVTYYVDFFQAVKENFHTNRFLPHAKVIYPQESVKFHPITASGSGLSSRISSSKSIKGASTGARSSQSAHL